MRQREILYCDQTVSHDHEVFEFTYITIATGRTRREATGKGVLGNPETRAGTTD
jgi:hypothetical protein